MSMLGLIPTPPGRIVRGKVIFEGQDLLRLNRRQLRRIRGRDIAMVFQDPMNSLNPVLKVGKQIAEAVQIHNRRVGYREAKRRAIELLTLVGVPQPDVRYRQYPHEFSGGMRQRAMISMAIANSPKVLIADEPTTALDVTVQAQVLDVLRAAREETQAATILITHDLGLIAEMADRVVVMYAGRVVELSDVRTIFHNPGHPYTFGLMASLPMLDSGVGRLTAIPGQPPSLIDLPTGCAFHPRCRLSEGRDPCREQVPPLVKIGPEHRSACHFSDEMDGLMSETA